MVKYQASSLPLLQSVSPLWGVTITSQTNSSTSLGSFPPSASLSSQTTTSANLPSQTTITLPLDPGQLPQSLKLAISITIPIVFILLLASILVFFRHQNRRRSKNHPMDTAWQKPELSAAEVEARRLDAELTADHSILLTSEHREEIRGDTAHRAELPWVGFATV
jgi:hypothetical protein